MNSLSASKFHNETIVGFANSLWIHFFLAKLLWIHYLPRDFTMKSLSVSWIHFESTVFCKITMDCQITIDFFICYAKSLWIHYFFVISIWMHYLLHDFTSNSSCLSQFHYLFLEFPMDSLSPSRNHLKSTMCFVISIWIYYLLREFTRNSSSFREFTICFANFLWIHYRLRDFSLNSLSFFEFTISFAHSRWIHNLLRNYHDFPMKSLWNHHEFTICFTSFLWIHYLLREITLNPLCVS